MTRREKREAAIRRNPKQVRFPDLDAVLRAHGFNGDADEAHVVYRHSRFADLTTNVPKPHGGAEGRRGLMMTTTERQGTMRRVVIKDDARRLASRSYAITVRPDADDGGYIAEVAEYPFFSGQGETPQEAEATLRHAIALAIAGDLLDGRPLVEPHVVTT